MGKDLKGKEIGKGIRQNSNGKYEARYVDRFGNRKSIYATSKIEIKNKLKEAQEENADKVSVKNRYTVNEWYKEWMQVYKENVIRKNSKRHYEHIFSAHILPEIGWMYVDEVKQIHVQRIINRLDASGYQYETQNKVRILLLDLFARAIENDYALKNPSKGIRISKTKTNDRVVLTEEQQCDFFECSAGTFYDNYYRVQVSTGLRPGEVAALNERDIDFDKKVIHVSRTLIYQKLDGDDGKEFHLGPPKTENSNRDVPINSYCEEALRKQIQVKKFLSKKYEKHDEFSDLIFVTKLNTPISSQILNDSIKRIVSEINIQRDVMDKFPEFSAHTFRHTFATRCIESGISPKVVQKYLGHATLQMTMDLYVHITDDFKKEEIKKLDAAFPKKNKIAPINGVKVG